MASFATKFYSSNFALELSSFPGRFEMAKSTGTKDKYGNNLYNWENKTAFILSTHELGKICIMFISNIFKFKPMCLEFKHLKGTNNPKTIKIEAKSSEKYGKQYNIEVKKFSGEDKEKFEMLYINVGTGDFFTFFVFCLISICKILLCNMNWELTEVVGVVPNETIRMQLPKDISVGNVISTEEGDLTVEQIRYEKNTRKKIVKFKKDFYSGQKVKGINGVSEMVLPDTMIPGDRLTVNNITYIFKGRSHLEKDGGIISAAIFEEVTK